MLASERLVGLTISGHPAAFRFWKFHRFVV